nr:funZ protein [Shewanella algae]
MNLGFRDAESYKAKDNKELLNSIFLKNSTLDELADQNKYFLIGEKGTGKTAYAVYTSNNKHKNTNSEIKYIRETEYKKFVELKSQKHLSLTDYTNIWKVIIMLLLSEFITSREFKYPLFQRFSKLNALKKSVDEFYLNAFSPEIISAINFAEESSLSASILHKNFKAAGEEKEKIEFSESRFQVNLLYIQKHFEEALSSIPLTENYTLYIDGIDIRPYDVKYDDYLDCVKGLANAIWSLNSDLFGCIKGSKGRLKTVLLVRPDIFDSIGFQNQNSKVKDNSVVLDWRTNYPEHRRSDLFHLADKLLNYQQPNGLDAGQAWDYYFPFNSRSTHYETTDLTSFVSLLRYSLYRPRAILVILSILKENFIEKGRNASDKFTEADLLDPMFTRKYADYFLGEIKDHLSFYYPASDYEHFIKFFQYLNGKSRFTYEQYLEAFRNYIDYFESNQLSRPGYCESPDIFLQFLYETNVIGYVVDTDDKPHFGWCHRERTTSNIAPKVKSGVRYEAHYAVMKSLDLGKKFKKLLTTRS